MAEVYRGHDRLLDRAVAIKLFWAPEDQTAHHRFDDEAVVLARLSHPGLVSIYDIGRLGDRSFLVMEFVDGPSLRSRLGTGPLPLDHVLSIGAILAEALAHAHERGVVHRDVRPSKIMLDPDGMPHLTGFGTSAFLALDQSSGAAADVYALASVLLECLAAEPSEIPADLPPAFAGLLRAMTSADPADRPSAAQCAALLLPEQPHEPPREPIAPPAPRWSTEDTLVLPPITRSHRRALAASFAGIAAVIVALVLLLNTQQPPVRAPQRGIDHAQGPVLTTQSQPANSPRATHSRSTLVANEHTVIATTTTTTAPPTTSPSTTQTPAATTPPATTSSAPTTTPQATATTSSIPPTTSSVGPTAPTATSG
jgi:serine/threonine protein kinase